MLWLGVLPLVVSVTYYAVKKAPDLDSALTGGSSFNALSKKDVLWTIRVGGTSSYRSGVGFYSTSFGVNAEDKDSQLRASKLANRDLSRTYKGTYVVRVRAAVAPRVVCVFRDVAPDGTDAYEIQDLGSRPIGFYVLYIALGSLGILVLLKAAKMFRARKG